MKRCVTWMVCLLLAGAALAEPNAFVELLPALKTLPAPPGAVEGLRLTYYSSAATVPGVYHSYTLDKDGNWVDDKGNRYRQNEEPGSGGHGYTTVDLTALDAKGVRLHVSSWGRMAVQGTEAVLPLATLSVVSPWPAAGGDFYLHPKALTNAYKLSSGETKILNMPYRLGQKTFKAVCFQYEKPNARTVYVFDLETGVLLHSDSMVKNNTRTMLTQNTLLDVREIAWPWLKAAPPAWLPTLKSLRGSGTHTTLVPGSMPFTQPIAIQNDVLARGTDWVTFRQTLTRGTITGVPSLPEIHELVTGPGQYGGLWLPPAGLAGLKDGQVLDQDKVTGIEVVVSAVNAPVDGRNAVIITERAPAFYTSFAYDRDTGMLLHTLQENQALYSRIDVAFQQP